LILLDSTVIVGFLDADDDLHELAVARLKELVAEAPLAASVVSYVEVMTGVSLGHHPRRPVDAFFDALVRELLPVTREVAARAATLRGKLASLKMPDALIIATADLHEDIDTIVCADAQWPKVKGLGCRVELLKAVGRSRPAGPRR
jgi:predicted nucleic acid-binding protein